MNYISIAIDGPSGAGKSTLASKAAATLGYLYVDTGAIYRTVGLFAQQKGVDPSDVTGVTALLAEIKIELGCGTDGLQHMYLMGVDVTSDIRQHVISDYASHVSAIPAVREFLLDKQRELARGHNVIMDGRDIGTVVLPNASIKVFLTAGVEERAYRRYLELLERGQQTDFETVLSDIIQRDKNDMSRPVAPLRPAEDSILVDTSGRDLEQSFALLMTTIKERLPHE